MLTLRAGYNAPALGGNINTGYSLVVSLQLIQQLERVARPAIELDVVVSGDSKGGMVGRERVVGDGIVEEMVNLGIGHCV